jgi:hypothetical protein
MDGVKVNGKGGGLFLQITSASAVVYLPFSTATLQQDPRLGEDTESDDLGSHFSASGAQVPSGEIVLHRRDINHPESGGLLPGLEIYRMWIVLGSKRVGTPLKAKTHMLFRTTLGTWGEEIAEVAPNLPIRIAFQGGAAFREVNAPTEGATPAASPVLPSGS